MSVSSSQLALGSSVALSLALLLAPEAASQCTLADQLSPEVGVAPPPGLFGPAGIRFGDTVSVSGSWAAVTSPSEASGAGRGMVSMFERVDGLWVERQQLFGTTGQFGVALDLHEDTLVVGELAPNGPFSFDTGLFHVFERQLDTWVETEAELIVTAGTDPKDLSLLDRMTIAVDDQAFAVGSPEEGAVYVYDRIGGQFELADRLAGESTSSFGSDIDLEGGTLVVLDPLFPAVADWECPTEMCVIFGPTIPAKGPDKGAVSVFGRNAITGIWQRSQILVPTLFDDPDGWFVGDHVELSEGHILVTTRGAFDGWFDFSQTEFGAFIQTEVTDWPYQGLIDQFVNDGDQLVILHKTGFPATELLGFWQERKLVGTDNQWLSPQELSFGIDSDLNGTTVDFEAGRLFVGFPYVDGESDAGGDASGIVQVYHLPYHGVWWEKTVRADLRLPNGDLLIDEPIGTLRVGVDEFIEEGKPDRDWIQASFRFDLPGEPDLPKLDNCYDFRWVNVLVSETAAAQIVVEDDVLGFLPAIDPTPANDAEPFYHEQIDFDTDKHVEGEVSFFFDAPFSPTASHEVLNFRTYLVARQIAPGNFPEQSFLPLASFDWTYTAFGQTIVPCHAVEQTDDAILAALANGFLPGHLGSPGFPGWNPLPVQALNACPSLSADFHELSVASGGSVQWTLARGKSFPGESYLILGSLSGTAPGLPLAVDVTLPLNYDAYTQQTLLLANSGPFVDTLGLLDANGTGAAQLLVAGGQYPSLVGLSMHHASVGLNLFNGDRSASNPVELTFVP